MHTPTDEKELLRLERTYWKAVQDGDVATATGLTSFPCLLNGSRGFSTVDKPTFIKMMGDRSYSIDRVSLSDDAAVRFLGDDVALVAYQVHEEVTVNGQPLSIEASESSTWVRRHGRWSVAQHTEALSGDPFGRDKHQAQAAVTEAEAAASQHEESAIRELIARWHKAAESHDAQTMLGLMTEDAVFQLPGLTPFGKDALATYVGGARSNKIQTVISEVEELRVFGDWAFARLHLVVDVTPPEGPTTQRSGHTLTLFQKNAQGQWRLAREANAQIEAEQPAVRPGA